MNENNTCDWHKLICWGSITNPKIFGIKAFLVFLIMFDELKKKKKIIINYFFYKICQQEIHLRETIISI